jgi:hypothetical protein
MTSKRPVVRAWGAVALAALLVSSSAIGAKKNKKPKSDEPDHKAGLMEEGEKDPAETETADEGQFAPGKKYVPEEERIDDEGNPIPPKKTPEQVAQEKRDRPRPPPRKTIGVFGEALIGFGKAPQPGGVNPLTGSATSIGVLVGGHFDVSTAFRLQLRVPWTTATIDGNTGSTSSSALGVPEIAGRLRLTEPGETEWAVRLGVGIPVAQGNLDLTDARDSAGRGQGDVQRIADAANGWHDPELYAVKRIPITPSVMLTHRTGGFRLGAELKAVIMPKVGGSLTHTDFDGGTLEYKSLAFSTILGATGSYEVVDHVHIALAAWAVYQAIPSIDFTSAATSPSSFQFVLEPKVLAQFGHVVPSIGYVLPLGGQLGGNISGLRLHVDVVF